MRWDNKCSRLQKSRCGLKKFPILCYKKPENAHEKLAFMEPETCESVLRFNNETRNVIMLGLRGRLSGIES